MAPPLPPSRDDAAAEQALREGLARVPGDVVRLNDLGNLLRATHRAEEAVEAYRRAVFLRPGDGGLRGNLAMALIEAHRPGEAPIFFRPRRRKSQRGGVTAPLASGPRPGGSPAR